MSGAVDSIVEIGTFGIVDDFSGTEAAREDARRATAAGTAAQVQGGQQAIAEERRASQQGLGFLEKFAGPGQQGLDQASFLTNPQEQFDFLQSNPLFQQMLDNVNRSTMSNQAARGKLGSGSTLERLSQNSLLTAMPLIADQKQSIAGLLDFGRGLATSQANVSIGEGSNVSNLLSDIGTARSAGIIGGQNAQNQIRQSADQLYGGLLGMGAGALI